MKFAYIVLCELRAITKTVHSLYENIIDRYNCDIIIVCQKLDDKDEENILLFDRNVIYKKMYNKPNPIEYFEKDELNNKHFDNWNSSNCLQIYINWNEVAKVLEDFKDKYDYFIQLRTDISILFPLPDKELFENIPFGIYSFDPNYCRTWGGWVTGVFIHKNYVIDYFKCCNDAIILPNSIEEFVSNTEKCNQENFKIYAMNKKKLEFKYIKNLNLYFTSESINSYTTWSIPIIHPKYNVICKYDNQCEEAFQNLELWNNGYRWIFINNEILLSNI